MATFEKGILGGFSGKVGNVVGSRWRGKNVMRSLPQRGKYTPSEKQEEQRQKFKTVIGFLSPIGAILSEYFGNPQGDKSRSNLATSYHLKNAVINAPQGMVMDYAKVLISKGDLRGIDTGTLTIAPAQTINLGWTDNSGQGKATATDELMVVVYAPDLNLFYSNLNVATRNATTGVVTLPSYMSSFEVEVWGSFYKPDTNFAAVSTYLGNATVL
ncbi:MULTISPECIES: DUF6266 family protein [Polaribacter]|uniref:DUF6266 family protein n=1 Tax=Polaribacter sejongensis TaxID=985043 RepID=A0AAJ1QXY5_9FLAO|nr:MULTISPECIES: DUF6266 family protein [Polaribacter]AUC23229.1 hypothetical protein BTO15_14500 [Polaribacter sejongensis]MDN3620167.1 DUF6266 family protein [Polaribacter undariae]UWD32569.1 DUF6266 family protein [Polaribacter undariae]